MSLTVEELIAGSEDHLVVADRGAVRFLVFNRPAARNAMTIAMRQGLAASLAAADADPAVKVVVVAGAGGIFTAGVDIKERHPGEGAPMVRPHPGEALRGFCKPSIAAVDGPCVTGGLEVVLSCGFILASNRARFADTHAKVGLFAAWGLSAMLPRAVGVRRARQMMTSGQFIDAQTAYDWGLVNELTGDAAPLDRAIEIADAIVGCNAASVDYVMEALREGDHESLAQALDREEQLVARWRAVRAAQART